MLSSIRQGDGFMAETVLLGIGGNTGNPKETLQRSFRELTELAIGNVVTSSIWRSEASGLRDRAPDFANAVARFQCDLEPPALLKNLQDLEVKFGRPADHAYRQSRTLDLDIIAFGQRIVADACLQIPHPRAWERLFVLLPLQELEPGFRFADRGSTLQQLIDSAPAMAVCRWHD